MKTKMISIMLKFISKYCTNHKGAVIEKAEKIDGTIIYCLAVYDYQESDEHEQSR